MTDDQPTTAERRLAILHAVSAEADNQAHQAQRTGSSGTDGEHAALIGVRLQHVMQSVHDGPVDEVAVLRLIAHGVRWLEQRDTAWMAERAAA